MEIDTLVKKFIPINKRKDIVRKSSEYSRLIGVRAPSGLGEGEICKNAVCVDLACSELNVDFDRDAVMTLCGVGNLNVYINAYTSIQNILRLKSNLTLESIGAKFNMRHVVKLAKANLDSFKEKFLANVEPHRRQHADFSHPAFQASAFYLAVKQNKMTLERRDLLKICLCTLEKYSGVEKSMCEILGIKTEEKEQSSKPSINDSLNLKRKQDEEDDYSDLEGEEIAEGVDAPGVKKSKKRQKKEEYNEWTEKVLKKNKEENSKIKTKLKSSKQQKLTLNTQKEKEET